jgi:hypothetical protein
MRSRELENLSAVDFDLFSSRFDPLVKKIETEILSFENAQETDWVVVDVDLNSFSHFRMFHVCTSHSLLGVHSTGNSGILGWESPRAYRSHYSVGIENTAVENRRDVNSGYQFLSA